MSRIALARIALENLPFAIGGYDKMELEFLDAETCVVVRVDFWNSEGKVRTDDNWISGKVCLSLPRIQVAVEICDNPYLGPVQNSV